MVARRKSCCDSKTLSFIFTFFVLSQCFYKGYSQQVVDLGEIECEFPLHRSKCRMGDTCRFVCKNSCINDTATIWGTGIYTYDSPVCRSAVHDLRISTWDLTQRHGLLKRIADTKRYIGSVRLGIRTTDYGRLGYAHYGAFQFVNPRVQEEILDVTSLHRDYLYDLFTSEGSTQECHIGLSSDPRRLYFTRNSAHSPTTYSPTMITTNVSRWTSMTWPATLSISQRTGGFWCNVENSVYSNVMSLSMRKDARVLPRKFTITTSVGKVVTLELVRQRNFDSWQKITWQKEGEDLPSATDQMLKRRFNSVKIGDGGVYTARLGDEPVTAAMRLIVRVCPENKTGKFCEEDCPECQNGGVCHDVMKTCICPPGFKGSLCEQGCGPDRFGQDCQLRCSDTNPDKQESCRGILFCLPDPYGCSCAAGFKGPKCDQNCTDGQFGADCSHRRECHCMDDKNCSPFTGTCPEGCDEGWYGYPYCNISYPYFSVPPNVSNITSSSVVVKFDEWTGDEDKGHKGVGRPSGYIVEYKEPTVDTNWTIGAELVSNAKKYEAIVTNLKPDIYYWFRVVVVDSSGNKQRKQARDAIRKTLCGEPLAAPQILFINKDEPRKVELRWQNPPPSTWQCRSVTIYLNLTSPQRTIITTVSDLKDIYSFQTSPYELWWISLWLNSSNGLAGPVSEVTEIRTAQDAPSEVLDVKANGTQPGIIHVSWMKPLEENGIITYYRISYQQTGWKHDCPGNFDENVWENVTSEETKVVIRNIKPSAFYKIVVVASTIKEGPPSEEVLVDTAEDLPSAPPQNLTLNGISPTEIHAKWDPPRCENASGVLTGYFIVCEAVDPWDPVPKKLTSPDPTIQIENLIPFTRYRVRVTPKTAVGYGHAFTTATAKTKPGVPPSPTDLVIYKKTSKILGVSWKPPYPPHGKLLHYVIHISGREDDLTVFPSECKDEIRKGMHCCTIGNLAPQQKYTISIIAYNRDVQKGSLPSEEVTGETDESFPDPPSSVDLIERTNTSLTIIWKEPYLINGNLTVYRANLTATNSFNASVIGYHQSFDISGQRPKMFTFTNLYPATEYNVSVEAATGMGFGEPTIIRVTTQHNAPIITKDIKILNIGDTTVDIQLHQVDFDEGPVNVYYVVVEENYHGRGIQFESKPPQSYNSSLSSGIYYYVTGAFTVEDFSHSDILNFTIGDGGYYGGYYNAPLKHGKRYNFGLALLSNFSGEIKYGYKAIPKAIFLPGDSASIINGTAGIVGAVLGVFTVLLFAIIAAVVIFLYKRPATLIKMQNSFRIGMDANHKEIVPYGASVGESNFIIENDMEMDDIKSHKIPLNTLEDYVNSVTEMGGLKHEFLGINKGQLSSWEYAKRPENKSKNRFGNLLPYDNTRVVLDIIDDDPTTDYINANYVDGYEAPGKYIATQGPKPLTVNDFWRMIWQVESCKIIMVTNLVENGKTICEKYWPDTVENYGAITVTLIKTDMFADFVIRTFEIEKDQESRKVKQFHFTSWPDHGVPMYSVSVVTFLKRVRSFKPNCTAPIVVHCSAGIGRTGTIILLDSMLDMARKEQYVDILGHLCKIRQQRVNLVQVLEQYIFVHQALVEAVCYEGMSILCSEFFTQYNRLKQIDPNTGQLYLEHQLERLNRLTPPLKSHFCHGALSLENKHKNRRSDVLPPDRARPYLKEANENKSNYINAVYVNGYKRKDAFIATQLPFPHTASDFWQMIFETNSKSIVLLNDFDPNDQTCPQYWPEGTNSIAFGKLTISCMSTEINGDIIIRTFAVSDSLYQNTISSKVVKQFQVKGWKPSAKTPVNAELMVDLIDKVERWQKQVANPPITVQCYDGNRACGLYCASVFVCDKIKTEQEVDVFLAVRSIRTNRPQFIEDTEQYQFLFTVAVAFLDSFETYSNFK